MAGATSSQPSMAKASKKKLSKPKCLIKLAHRYDKLFGSRSPPNMAQLERTYASKRQQPTGKQTEQQATRVQPSIDKPLVSSPPCASSQRLCPPTPRYVKIDCRELDCTELDKMPFADPKKEIPRQIIDVESKKIHESPMRASGAPSINSPSPPSNTPVPTPVSDAATTSVYQNPSSAATAIDTFSNIATSSKPATTKSSKKRSSRAKCPIKLANRYEQLFGSRSPPYTDRIAKRYDKLFGSRFPPNMAEFERTHACKHKRSMEEPKEQLVKRIRPWREPQDASPPRDNSQRLCPPTPRYVKTDCRGLDWAEWDKMPFGDQKRERARRIIDAEFEKLYGSPWRAYNARSHSHSPPSKTPVPISKTTVLNVHLNNSPVVRKIDFGASKKSSGKPLHMKVRNRNFLSSQKTQ